MQNINLNEGHFIPSSMVYSIMHGADIGDRSVHLTFDGQTETQVKDLVSFIQLKAENMFDEYATLDNSTIAEFLAMCGASIIEKQPNYAQSGFTVIDAHEERESRICGSSWIGENYNLLDRVHGDKAAEFLQKKVEGKDWYKSLI